MYSHAGIFRDIPMKGWSIELIVVDDELSQLKFSAEDRAALHAATEGKGDILALAEIFVERMRACAAELAKPKGEG